MEAMDTCVCGWLRVTWSTITDVIHLMRDVIEW